MIEAIKEQKEQMKVLFPLSLQKRKSMLLSLQKSIKEHETDIYEALYLDLKKDEWEVYVTELSIVYEELHHALKNVKKWHKPKRIKTPLVQFPARNYMVHDAYGQVLIMSPWNYPLQLTLVPLIGAIAAGNFAVVKPSAYAPHIAEVMQRIIQHAFPAKEVLLFLGGRNINEEILTYPYDFIFFTGSTSVGKVVMRQASDHLTPIVLELGGKSPLIIAEDADLPLTIRRLKFAKLINNGQTCVAPDYVLLSKKLLPRLEEIKRAFDLLPEEQERLPKIVNEKHYLRLKEYLTDLGLSNYVDNTQTIWPTIILNPPFDSKVMQEEIFGPILPIIVYENLQEAIQFINERPKPLALYLFTKSRKTIRAVTSRTSSGSLAINDAVVQLANVFFPFGGVGFSGMGSYHGYHSFKTFSHQKGVLHKSRLFDFSFRYEPGPRTVHIFKKLTRNK